MPGKKLIFVLLGFFCVGPVFAQFCPRVGQTPKGAYPICGNVTLTRAPTPFCAGPELIVPGCRPNEKYTPFYPTWFKFTCYTDGLLGFQVIPTDYIGDDYDWQLFDVTGQPVLNAFFFSHTVALAGNWTELNGVTGAQPGGTKDRFSCPDGATLTHMLPLFAGHNYLLLICHHKEPPPEPRGFTLTITGGNADIGDPTMPHLSSASTPCGGTPLTIRFNKKLRCSSVLTDGSQFTISPSLANVVSAGKMGCDDTYELDSLVVQLDSDIPAGTYTLSVKPGSDGTEIKDFCDNTISASETISFKVNTPPVALMNSIINPGCNPNELEIGFSQKINCASIAADGSDFVVTGSSPVTIIGASGAYCIADPFYNSYSATVKIKLSAPISGKGNYQVKLVKGSDGNTVQDQCKAEVSAGATLAFSTKDTVNADFSYNVHLGCKTDTINYFHPGGNEINEWTWDFDGLQASSLQAPQILYTEFGLKYAQLIVSNGACKDTSALVPIMLDNELKAGFEATNTICPGDPASFKDSSRGHIISWLWNFGNGITSSSRTPVPQFYSTQPVTYSVIPQLIVTNSMGCTSTASQKIDVLNRCLILVPGAFTPNNDGLNDYLYPLNGYRSSSLWFIVYNRYGQVMFETRDPAKRWDGKFKGQVADPGTYIWILHYTDKFTNEYVEQKGTSILIR